MMNKKIKLINDMRYNVKYRSSMVAEDINKFGMTSESILRGAVLARFELDTLLLDGFELIDKWGQDVVYNHTEHKILFRGTRQECKQHLEELKKKDNVKDICGLYYVFPNEKGYSWSKYFHDVKIRCGITIV